MSKVDLALLAIVEPKWLKQACEEFKQGKKEIEFGTNSPGVGPALNLPIRHVYFKTKGQTNAVARAEFIRAASKKNRSKVLCGTQNEPPAKYYYDFRNLERLEDPIPLSQLQYRNGNFIRNDIAGSWIVLDPLPA